MRFANIYTALEPLRRSQDPKLQSEAEIAMRIIWGERPGVEAKYDALLIKLDRTYSELSDRRDHFNKLIAESVLAHNRMKLKARLSEMNAMLNDLNWMRARNSDMIAALQPENATDSEPQDDQGEEKLQVANL
jgi:hypothetical protein